MWANAGQHSLRRWTSKWAGCGQPGDTLSPGRDQGQRWLIPNGGFVTWGCFHWHSSERGYSQLQVSSFKLADSAAPAVPPL